jgi:transposase-like protein
MSDSPWRDKDTLYELYVERGLTTAEIGEKLGCTDVTISDWLDRHDIDARDPDPPTMTGEDHPRSVTRDELIEDYRNVAEDLGKTPSQEEYNHHEDSYTWSAIRGHFDSMGELQDAAGLERLRKGRVDIECDICGDEFNVKHAEKDARRFCSDECHTKWRKEAYTGENNHNYKQNIESTCEWCEETYTAKPHKEDSTRFCSQECMIEWRTDEIMSGENHPRWKNNDDYYRGPNWHQQREEARDRDNNECQHCGSEDQLQVHHIIPFESFDDYREANKLQNLITLCVSCHHKLEWGSITVQSGLDRFR